MLPPTVSALRRLSASPRRQQAIEASTTKTRNTSEASSASLVQRATDALRQSDTLAEKLGLPEPRHFAVVQIRWRREVDDDGQKPHPPSGMTKPGASGPEKEQDEDNERNRQDEHGQARPTKKGTELLGRLRVHQ